MDARFFCFKTFVFQLLITCTSELRNANRAKVSHQKRRLKFNLFIRKQKK